MDQNQNSPVFSGGLSTRPQDHLPFIKDLDANQSQNNIVQDNAVQNILQAYDNEEASESLYEIPDSAFLINNNNTVESAQLICKEESEEKNTQTTTNTSSLPTQDAKTPNKKRLYNETEPTEFLEEKRGKKSKFGRAIVIQRKNIPTNILDKHLNNRLALFKAKRTDSLDIFYPFFKPESNNEKYLNYTRCFLNTYKFPWPITLFITKKFILQTPMISKTPMFEEKITSLLKEIVQGNSVPVLKNITDLLIKKIELSDTGRARQLLKNELELASSSLNNESDMAKFIKQTIATLNGK